MSKNFRLKWQKVEDTYHAQLAIRVNGVLLEGASAVVFPQDGGFIGRVSFASNKHLNEDYPAASIRAAKTRVRKRIKAVFNHLYTPME